MQPQPEVDYREIPKGHLFNADEAERRKLWALQFIGTATGVFRVRGYGLFVGGSLVRDIDLVAVPWRQPQDFKHPDSLVLQLVHDLGVTMGNRGTTMFGHHWYALWDKNHPDHQIDLKVILPARFLYTEDSCPGHVAADPKVCTHCGINVDSLRPPAADGPPRPYRASDGEAPNFFRLRLGMVLGRSLDQRMPSCLHQVFRLRNPMPPTPQGLK